jgi:ribosomal protein S27AE
MLTLEHKQKIGLANKGKISPFRGQKRNPDIGRKISEALQKRMKTLGYRYSEEGMKTKRGISPPPEVREKISKGVSETLKRQYASGKRVSARKGKPAWNTGLKGAQKWSPEQHERLSGRNSPNWKGGTSLLPYNQEFYDLRYKVLRRDNYTCQLCGVQQFMLLHVHHIDFNKQNNSVRNLITLCGHCHRKLHGNNHNWVIRFLRITRKQ